MTKEKLEKEAKDSYWDSDASGALSSKENYVIGYIAGAEAHSIKWHEIENKTTPSREISKKYMLVNKRKVLLKYHFSNEEEIHISDGYFDDYDHTFHIPNNPTCKIICAIAWAELEE